MSLAHDGCQQLTIASAAKQYKVTRSLALPYLTGLDGDAQKGGKLVTNRFARENISHSRTVLHRRPAAPSLRDDEIMMIVNDVNLDRHRAVKHDHDHWQPTSAEKQVDFRCD